MTRLAGLLLRYGVSLVALNVFLEQIGAPIPALPTLIVAGALTRNGKMSSTHVLVAAVLSSVIADYIWYVLGRIYGYRLLKVLCRVSLSPDSCVRDTEARFERWGMKSLLIAKFIPGYSTIAPPLAGVINRSAAAFLLYDAIGALLWAGAAVAAGRAFHTAIARLLGHIENLGWWAIVLVAALLALVVVVKWWQRIRFMKTLRVARIGVDELHDLISRGEAPTILDVRTGAARRVDPRRIPTAQTARTDAIDTFLAHLRPSDEIVLYCT